MIHIQWDTGYMNINPDKFFPCTLDTLKGLKKKVINISHNREEVIGQIRDHLRELRIPTRRVLSVSGSTVS